MVVSNILAASRMRREDRGSFDLDEHLTGLPPDDVGWIKGELGDAPTFDRLDRLSAKRDLTDDQRRIVEGLRRAVVGAPIESTGRVITHEGDREAAAVPAYVLRQAVPPSGETPEQTRLREEMPRALIGQLGQLEEFVKVLKDYQSPARRSPPLMGLVGDPGHGKDQALIGYTRSVFGEKARVIAIDLSDVKDDDYPKYFGEGGPLSVDVLKKMEKEAAGVLRIQGAEDLAKRSPKIADGIVHLLTAKRGEADYARVHYFIDFDQKASCDPRRVMVDALGAAGNRMLSAFAAFKHLDGPSMAEYAKGLLPEILAQDGLSRLVLQYDPEALQVLGDVLATPHAPLDELEARLLRFILSKFDTQTSVARDGSVLRLMLAAPYQRDRDALASSIAALHEEYPDLFQGAMLFDVYEVGRPGVSDENRNAIMDAAKRLEDELKVVAEELAKKNAHVKAGAPLAAHLSSLARELNGAIHYAERNLELRVLELITARRQASLSDAIEEAASALEEFVGANGAPKKGDDSPKAEALRRAERRAAFCRALLDAARALGAAMEKGVMDRPIHVPEADKDGGPRERKREPVRPEKAPDGEKIPDKKPPPDDKKPVDPVEDPELLRFQADLRQAGIYRPPRVVVECVDGDPANGWKITATNNLPAADERGALGFVGTMKVGHDGAVTLKHFYRPGQAESWMVAPARGVRPGTEIFIGTRGMGWWIGVPLPGGGQRVDTGERPALWRFAKDQFARQKLSHDFVKQSRAV